VGLVAGERIVVVLVVLVARRWEQNVVIRHQFHRFVELIDDNIDEDKPDRFVVAVEHGPLQRRSKLSQKDAFSSAKIYFLSFFNFKN
jgi:hypothetical protein